MNDRHCVVFDVNVFISAALFENSIPYAALEYAYRNCIVVMSDEIEAELAAVIFRNKFAKYMSEEKRHKVLERTRKTVRHMCVETKLTVCRDRKDDKYLELAVDSCATWIVTGDADLLVLNPFGAIAILTPAEFLAAVTFQSST